MMMYERVPVVLAVVLVAVDPRKLRGWHALDDSLEAQGTIIEIRPATLVLDLGEGHLAEFPTSRCCYERDW